MGMYYVGYTTIAQYRPDVPEPLALVCWVALAPAAESVFVPLAVAPMPAGYEQGDTRRFANDSAWWAYSLVSDYANIRYDLISQEIQTRAASMEAAFAARVAGLQKELAPQGGIIPGAGAGCLCQGPAGTGRGRVARLARIFPPAGGAALSGFSQQPGQNGPEHRLSRCMAAPHQLFHRPGLV